MWLLAAFASAFFAGITAILAKIGMKQIDSDVATALRTIIIVIFSWGIVYVQGNYYLVKMVDINSLIYLITSGIATGLSWICYFKALSLGNVNKVAAIDKLSIVLTTFLAIVLFGEFKFLLIKLIAIFILTIGLILLVEFKKETKATIGYSWIVYAVLSAIFASLTAILGKLGVNNIDSNIGTAIRVCVIFVISWGFVFYLKKISLIAKIKRTHLCFILLSAITTALSWLCYYYALQKGVVSIVACIDKFSILITVICSYRLFGEHLNKKNLLGLLCIISGILLITIWR